MSALADNFMRAFESRVSGGVGRPLSSGVNFDMKAQLSAAGLTTDSTGLVYMATLVAAAESGMVKFPMRKSTLKTWGITFKEGEEVKTCDLGDLGSHPDPVWREFGVDVMESQEKARGWIVDLAACIQVKELKAKNIQSYFRGKDNTVVQGASLVDLFSTIASALPTIVEDGRMRGMIHSTAFTGYHTTYASSASLINKMLEALGENKKKLVSPDSLAKVKAAIDSPWDRNKAEEVPTKLRAMAHAFLSVYGVLPDNWYQGEKAMDETPAGTYAAWLALFKTLRDKDNTVAQIKASETVEDALGSISESMKA